MFGSIESFVSSVPLEFSVLPASFEFSVLSDSFEFSVLPASFEFSVVDVTGWLVVVLVLVFVACGSELGVPVFIVSISRGEEGKGEEGGEE